MKNIFKSTYIMGLFLISMMGMQAMPGDQHEGTQETKTPVMCGTNGCGIPAVSNLSNPQGKEKKNKHAWRFAPNRPLTSHLELRVRDAFDGSETSPAFKNFSKKYQELLTKVQENNDYKLYIRFWNKKDKKRLGHGEGLVVVLEINKPEYGRVLSLYIVLDGKGNVKDSYKTHQSNLKIQKLEDVQNILDQKAIDSLSARIAKIETGDKLSNIINGIINDAQANNIQAT